MNAKSSTRAVMNALARSTDNYAATAAFTHVPNRLAGMVSGISLTLHGKDVEEQAGFNGEDIYRIYVTGGQWKDATKGDGILRAAGFLPYDFTWRSDSVLVIRYFRFVKIHDIVKEYCGPGGDANPDLVEC